MKRNFPLKLRNDEMQTLSENEVAMVSGGMDWEGDPESMNVIDRRGAISRNAATGEILWGDTFYRYIGYKFDKP